MYLIVGLGNPERKYVGTRHNTGFAVIDALMEKLGVQGLSETKFNGAYAKTNYEGEQLILLKPMTYMNESGQSVGPMSNFYKIPADHIIICSDDINLDVGRLRIRPSGSAGGHNGLKSIIACVGSDQFPRVRVGVGMKPSYMDLADHVLSKFNADDQKLMETAYKEAADAVLDIVKNGVEHAENIYNRKKAE